MIAPLALLLFTAAEIPESQLVTQVNGKEVFPPAFRGTWSKSAATCRDENSLETFTVSEFRLDGYDWDAVLLKSTPMSYLHGPDNEPANGVVVLTAERGESEVSIGKARLTLMVGKLYMSNTEAVSEQEHLTPNYSNVRCRPE